MTRSVVDPVAGKIWYAALIIGIVGGAIGLSLSSGLGNFASITEAPADATTPRQGIASPLPRRLAALHDAIAIKPDQEPTWKRFAGEMTQLEALTRHYEREVASGRPVDAAKERARHAMIFGAAMNDVDASLSSEQTVRLHRLARDLAGSSICRTLAN